MSMLTPLRAGRLIRPARSLFLSSCLATALTLTALPGAAYAQSSPAAIERAIKSSDDASRDVRAFYKARDYRPLWIEDGTLGPAADLALGLIETADLDGLKPRDYRPGALAEAIEEARDEQSAKALAEAEMKLSQAFAAYVNDVTRPRDIGMIYADPRVAPGAFTTTHVLETAAAAPSLEEYLESAGWVHPIYTELREALADEDSRSRERLLRLNMERARALPAAGREGRYILVDTAIQRLWMYEDGRVVDTMRVVVGKPSTPTPMMAGMIRHAMVNPYWNVPPDLTQHNIAPNVIEQGESYLRRQGYELLSDWSDDARMLDPDEVDWEAVAAGEYQELRVRQLPGPANAMGDVKFEFPNRHGIYLHDSPERALFREAERRFSSGCIRLEDAARLGTFLFGEPLSTRSKKPEREILLPEPVPVYVTYLTVAPEGDRIVFRDDAYDRDAAQMALLESPELAAR